jgi:ABC-type nitrate/sulfonate/bicarbonate transport system ATPase subunit
MNGYVEIVHLHKVIDTPEGPQVVIEDFSMAMSKGECVCLLGKNGCGKSTLLAMLAGTEPMTRGKVVIANHQIDGPGPDRGITFASPCLVPWMTPLENLLLGIDQVLRHEPRRQREQIAVEFLSLLGLAKHVHTRTSKLSPGLKQRVSIARVAVLKPRLLLLDDPFCRLDQTARAELQEVLQQLLMRENLTTLMVTQDVDEALLLGDRAVVMSPAPRAVVAANHVIPFPRPRLPSQLCMQPEYLELRARLNACLVPQGLALQIPTSPPALQPRTPTPP